MAAVRKKVIAQVSDGKFSARNEFSCSLNVFLVRRPETLSLSPYSAFSCSFCKSEWATPTELITKYIKVPQGAGAPIPFSWECKFIPFGERNLARQLTLSPTTSRLLDSTVLLPKTSPKPILWKGVKMTNPTIFTGPWSSKVKNEKQWDC